MVQIAVNRTLYESMATDSMLGPEDRRKSRAWSLIYRELVRRLRPEEEVLAYADRDLAAPDQTDILSGVGGTSQTVPDTMAYQPGGPEGETDIFSGDTGASHVVRDVLGYRPGGPANQTDALHFESAPSSPETDAMRPPEDARAVDVDFLVLTTERLIRGFLENERAMLTEAGVEEVEVRLVDTRYIGIKLPSILQGLREGDWWTWLVPEGVEAKDAAAKWSRRRK